MKSELRLSVCLSDSVAPFSFSDDKDRCVTRTLSLLGLGLVRKTLVRSDIRNGCHILNTVLDLCLKGLTALASVNWRGGSWYPTPTTMASLYRVRQTSLNLSPSPPAHIVIFHLFKAVVSLWSPFLSDTTREKRRQEREGVDYHFVSIQKFEEDILSHRYDIRRCYSWVIFSFGEKIVPTVLCSFIFYSLFMRIMFAVLLLFDYHFILSFLPVCVLISRFIEYGRYRGHYYGTSLDSVHRVMAEGKVCLLDVHPSVSVMPLK